MRLTAAVMATTLVLSGLAWGEEPAAKLRLSPVQMISRQNPTNTLELRIGGVTAAADGGMLLGVMGWPRGGGVGGAGVCRVDVKDPRASTWPWWDELGDGSTPVYPQIKGVATDSQGRIILLGRFEEDADRVIRVDGKGNITKDRPIFSPEKNPRAEKCVPAGEGRVLIVGEDDEGAIAALLDSSLQPAWQARFPLPTKSFLLTDALYDAARRQFVIVGMAGRYSKLGVPIDNDSHIVLLALDEQAKVIHHQALQGFYPKFAAGPQRYALLYERSMTEEKQQFALTLLDQHLTPVVTHDLFQVAGITVPVGAYFSMLGRANGTYLIAGNAMQHLQLKAVDQDGTLVAAGVLEREAGEVPGFTHLVEIDGKAYLVTAANIMARRDRPADEETEIKPPSMRSSLRVERVDVEP